MKKLGSIVLLFIFSILCFACSSNDSKEVAIKYTTFKGHPVEIVFYPESKSEYVPVELRIRFEKHESYDLIFQQKWLTFLKEEVLRLTSTNRPLPLGKDYTFEFLGGYPAWYPCAGHYFRSLRFADLIKFDGRVIQAWGSNREWNGYKK